MSLQSIIYIELPGSLGVRLLTHGRQTFNLIEQDLGPRFWEDI